MNRRGFLTLKSDRRLELSCERLFMQCLQAPGATEPSEAWDLWQPAEPPADYRFRSVRDLVDTLESDLREIDVVRLTDQEWLIGDVRRELDRVLANFRARGGRVEVERRRET